LKYRSQINKEEKTMAKRKSRKKKSRGRKKKGGSLAVLIIAVVLIAALIVVSKVKRGEPERLLKANILAEFGVSGDKEGMMNSPRGLAVSPAGMLYVADLNNSRIDKYTLDGRFAGSFGKKGDKKTEFKEPSGVAVDQNNNVYVADAWNGRIQKFDAKGKYLMEIGGTKGGFYSPRNCAVSKYGVLYVADTGTSRVHRFDLDGNRLGAAVGGQGKAADKFNEVFSVAFDSKGRVYVSDAGNRRIVILTSDLKPLGTLRVRSWEEVFPLWPMIAVDGNDLLYAVGSGSKDISVYDTKEKRPKYIGTIKNDVKDKPIFSDPVGIAIDSSNAVYISEIAKNRIEKIQPIFDRQ
jgi:tripartite motif-containing protein 71